jgi:single-strand DNA-binding protein
MNLNKVMLAGNLTRDVELKYTPSGREVAELALAVNERWKNAEGQVQEATTFVECRAWGKLAATLANHFYKGKPIFIEGRMRQEEWTDKETQKKRRKTLVIVDTFQFLNDGKGAGAVGGQRTARPAGGAAVTRDGGSELAEGMEDDDIPF